MKKILICLLLIVMCLSIVSCSKDEEVDNMQTISNPWEICKAEDIEDVVGYTFGTLDGALDTVYSKNVSSSLVEMEFELNDVSYTCRVKKSEENQDISGLYYTIEKSEITNILDKEWTVNSFSDGSSKIVSYSCFDEELDLEYNLAMVYDRSLGDIEAPISEIFTWLVK